MFAHQVIDDLVKQNIYLSKMNISKDKLIQIIKTSQKFHLGNQSNISNMFSEKLIKKTYPQEKSGRSR